MPSFFNDSNRKRKRPGAGAGAADGPKKRVATTSGGGAGRGGASNRGRQAGGNSSRNGGTKPKPGGAGSKKKAAADQAEDDESISGSDSESDNGANDANAEEDDGFFDDDEEDDNSDLEGEDGQELTAADRRLRYAERYVENLKREVAESSDRPMVSETADGKETYIFDAEDVDRELIAARLQEDVAEAKGRVYRRLASDMAFAQASHCLWRWNSKNVNAVAVCAPYAYTVSSDAYLTKWRIQDLPEQQTDSRVAAAKQQLKENKSKNKKANKKKYAKKVTAARDLPAKKKPERVLQRRGDIRRRGDKSYQGHVGAILCVAASQDGKFVVTGGADRRLVVYDAETLKVLRVFTRHRDAVTGLVFRRGTNQLYVCSADRTISVWSLDELAYVQMLFGHQEKVVDIDALAPEKCLSVGARDRTARLWKVVEETQLVFRGGLNETKKLAKSADAPGAHEGSMDRVAMLDDELFVTGSDNGALALWSTQKKKPLWVVPRAHGVDPVISGREKYDKAFESPEVAAANPLPPQQPRWITALRTVPYSDVVLSGSWDGCVRVWRLSDDKRKLEALGVLGEDGPVVEEAEDKAKASEESSEDKAEDEAMDDADSDEERGEAKKNNGLARIRGVVNGIAVFERGDRAKDGLSIVVGVGREHRLGRWGETVGSRNGAIVFEVPRLGKAKRAAANGVNGVNGTKANGVAK